MFAHNAHTQLDTKNLNVYINGAQILKDGDRVDFLYFMGGGACETQG